MRVSLLSIALLAAMAVGGCDHQIEPGTTGSPPAAVLNLEVETAAYREEPLFYEAVGTVRARTTTTVAAKLMARVTKVLVQEGDQVSKGQLLATLARKQPGAVLQQAQAQLAAARKALAAAEAAHEAAAAAAELAAATFKRYQALREQESVSVQEFDEVAARHRQAQAALDQAQAQVEAAAARVRQAKAAVAAARVGVADTRILAPYAGIIVDKMVEVGDLATPGRPLFNLDAAGGYRLHAVLPESYRDRVQIGQAVTVAIPALDLQGVAAKVNTIIPATDPQSRSFLLKIELPAGIAARSGMFGRARISLGTSSSILIPARAVIHRGQLTGLYLVGPDQRARFRLIRLGRHLGDRVEVISGLKPGDRYLAAPPATGAVEGARVEGAA